MAINQARATLQAGAGLSSTNIMGLANTLAKQNAQAEALLMMPSQLIQATGDQRMANALNNMYGARGQIRAAKVVSSQGKRYNAAKGETAMDAQGKAKGLRNKLRLRKGKPGEGPGSPGWGDAEGGNITPR